MQAPGGAAAGAVRTGAAGYHVIVVVVVQIFEAQAELQFPRLRERQVELCIGRYDSAEHAIVVVFTGRPGRSKVRRDIGGFLGFLQEGIGNLQIDPCG